MKRALLRLSQTEIKPLFIFRSKALLRILTVEIVQFLIVTRRIWSTKQLSCRSAEACSSHADHQREGFCPPQGAASPSVLQVLYAGSRGITPYRMKPVSMETEYRRNFRGLIPPTGPRLRKHLDHELEPLFHSYEVKPVFGFCKT